MDHIGSELVGCAEHREQWGDREVERVIAGHLHGKDRVEVAKIVNRWHLHACGSEDHQIAVDVVCGLRDVLDKSTDAVDVGEGVGELEHAEGMARLLRLGIHERGV